MSGTTAPRPLRAHAVAVSPAELQHRRQVVRWALSSGRGVSRDALAALVGARADDLADPTGVNAPTTWSADDIGSLLWHGVSSWCTDGYADVPEPHDVARTLDTYLRYLSANRLLAAGSDPVATLRRAITDYGGSRSRSHPAVRHRMVAPVVPIG